MKQIKNITAAEILKQIKLTVICGEEITETNVCDGFSTWMEQFDASNPYEAFTPESREYFQNKLFVAFAAGMLPAEVTETRTNEVGPDGCWVFAVETSGTLNPYEETEEETETAAPSAPSAPSANEETTAPAEEQTTDTEEEEEEQNMKPEYKHIYVEEARRQLEARTDRSAWDRAVTEDAINLLDTVNDTCEQISRKFAETEEGGAAHVNDLFVSRMSLMNIMKNGAESWSAYSWGGCGLIYDSDIAEHYCTPSELKKVRGGDRRPNSREEWLDVQARALRQAAGRAADALITASHKTYTIAV